MRNKILAAFFVLSLVISANISAQSKDGSKKEALSVTLTSSNYDKEISKGLVIVDFWAPWCGPCRKLAPILDEIVTENKGSVKLGKLNTDNYQKFAAEKKIEALPTIVIYKNGKEITRLVGLRTKAELEKIIAENK